MSTDLPPVTLEERAEIKIVYNTFASVIDVNKFKMTRKDFKNSFASMGFYLSKKEIDTFFDGKETIDYPTFKTIAIKSISTRDPLKHAVRMFHMFDKDHDGYISTKNLKEACIQCKDGSSNSKIDHMIDVFDSNKDGLVSLNDFLKLLGFTKYSISTLK